MKHYLKIFANFFSY